jgi:hypothetical protein
MAPSKEAFSSWGTGQHMAWNKTSQAGETPAAKKKEEGWEKSEEEGN